MRNKKAFKQMLSNCYNAWRDTQKGTRANESNNKQNIVGPSWSERK